MAQNDYTLSYTVDANITGLLKFDKAIDATTDNAVKGFKQVDQAAAGTSAQLSKTAQSVQEAGNASRNFSGVASNLGFQLQDVAVQAQAGASAFTILGQQGSQIASSFGPGGAVLGAVIAIAAAIGGVLVKSLNEASGKAGELPEALLERLEKIKARYKEIDEASRAAFTQAEIGKVNTEYEKQLAKVESLRRSVDLYSKETAKGNQGAAVAVKSYAMQLASAEKELRNLGELQARIGTDLLATNIEGGKETPVDNAAEAADRLNQQLQIAIAKLEEGDLAARRLAAAHLLGLTNAEMIPPELDKQLVKLVQLEEQQKKNAAAEMAWRKEAAALQQEILDDERAERQAAYQEQVKREQDIQRVRAGTTRDIETPAQAAQRELADRLKVVQEYYGLESAEKAKQTAEGIAAEQAYQKRLTEIRQAEEQKRLGFNNVTLTATADLFGNLASMAEQGGKDSFNAWKLFASAQAAVNAALAVTNALATIPPPLNFAVAGTVAAMTAAQIAKISSMSYGGGRLYGGPGSAGSLYPVTEGGKPGLLVQGNRQYLLPGAGGRVVSNKDMTSGAGGGMVVYVNPTTTVNAIDTTTAATFIKQNSESIAAAVDQVAAKYGRGRR